MSKKLLDMSKEELIARIEELERDAEVCCCFYDDETIISEAQDLGFNDVTSEDVRCVMIGMSDSFDPNDNFDIDTLREEIKSVMGD